jgi:hypothetical protein
VTAPCVQIVLAVEAAPRLRIDCATESEQERLLDWTRLDLHP